MVAEARRAQLEVIEAQHEVSIGRLGSSQGTPGQWHNMCSQRHDLRWQRHAGLLMHNKAKANGEGKIFFGGERVKELLAG